MKPQDLLSIYGSQAEIARVFGCKPQSVKDWFASDEIPEGRQYQAEIATKRKLLADLPADRRLSANASYPKHANSSVGKPASIRRKSP